MDTEDLIKIANGEIVTTEVLSIVEGKENEPRRNKRKHKEW